MAEDPPAANPDRSDTSIPPAVAASTRNRYLACAALYAVAYAAHGFDPSNAAVWAATLANAANLQLERLGGDCVVASSRSPRRLRRRHSPRRTPRAGKGSIPIPVPVPTGYPAGIGRGGEDPLPSLPFRALDVRLPDGLPSLPSVRAPEVPEITVESVGRAIGATQIAAAKLREEVEEGKIRAIIEQDAKAESERLERERTFAAEEIDAWDERFELRTMTRDGLLAIARERGMRGYSKLRRGSFWRLWSARFTETRTPRRGMRRSDESGRDDSRGVAGVITSRGSRLASRRVTTRRAPTLPTCRRPT